MPHWLWVVIGGGLAFLVADLVGRMEHGFDSVCVHGSNRFKCVRSVVFTVVSCIAGLVGGYYTWQPLFGR